MPSIGYWPSDPGEAGCAQGNLLTMNGLSPGMDKQNARLTISFRTPFFGFADSKGHSRFVLRILILAVSTSRLATRLSLEHGVTGVGDMIASDRPYHILTEPMRRMRRISIEWRKEAG